MYTPAAVVGEYIYTYICICIYVPFTGADLGVARTKEGRHFHGHHNIIYIYLRNVMMYNVYIYIYIML